jgi:hypothetical protein
MRKLSVALAVGALVATTAIASAQTPLTLQFGPGRDATQAGSVTITPQGNTTLVSVTMTQPSPGGATAVQPNHFHAGACPGVGAVVFPLTNLTNGKGETTINASWADIQAKAGSVNVHKSTTEGGVYTACVNLPVAQTTARPTGATQLPRTGGPALGLLALLGVAFGGVGFGLRRR